MTFEGRVVLVTGARRGIGKAIALAFAREKADVVVNDLCPEEDLARVADELSGSGGRLMPLPADVGRSDQVRLMMAQVEDRFGKLDVLVNNAGIIRRGTIETMTEEDWDEVIRVNLKGTFNCSRAAAAIMKRQGYGKIVNVSSVAAKT